MEIALNDEISPTGPIYRIVFRQNRVHGRILRTVGLVSTVNLACIAFGVYNAMEAAFRYRNVSNRTDISHSFSSKWSTLSHFANSRACFDDESGVHSIRRIKCDGNSD